MALRCCLCGRTCHVEEGGGRDGEGEGACAATVQGMPENSRVGLGGVGTEKGLGTSHA